MARILQILDTFNWAIDKLARDYVKQNPQFDWERIAVHPKELEKGFVDLEPVRQAIHKADIIDGHYWRTLAQLVEQIPELKKKKVILHHHNEKNLFSADWDYVHTHVAHTRYSQRLLEEKYPGRVVLVHNHYDNNRFHFNEYNPPEKAIGYVGRVVPWKGLKEIAQAAFELHTPLYLMGKIDKPSYFAEIPPEHQANINVEFMNCSDDDQIEFYKRISVYVGNSGTNHETGPLGVMEAMACAVPVVSTPAGIMADIGNHEKNAIIVPFGNYEFLKQGIKRVLDDSEYARVLGEAGWETIRNYNAERKGRKMGQVYYKVLFGEKPLVSFIIPATYERVEEVKKILSAVENQTHKECEAIVIWDELEEKDLLGYYQLVRQYITGRAGYNLGYARDLGVSYAHGEWLVFCDSRLLPDMHAVQEFLATANGTKAKVWFFGEKGGNKRHFVENFSCIRRDHFIKAGMSNQLITGYGGMSQELRERFISQGFSFVYVSTAEADQLRKATKNLERRQELINMKNILDRLDL